MSDTHTAPPRSASAVADRYLPAGARSPGRRDALLAAVAHAAEVLTATPDLRAALAEAAGVLGEATGVDRVNVMRYDDARAAGFLHAEWARPGVAPASAVDAGPYGYADYAEVWRPLMAGQVYASPLAEKTGANAALNVATAVKTDLFVPVLVDGAFWGALNFDDCTAERAWTDGEVEVLRAAAAAVGAAARREALERAHAKELARERERAAEHRAAELTRANAVLDERTRLLAVVVDVSTLLARAPDFDAALPEALHRIGRAAGLDRVVLLLEREAADCEADPAAGPAHGVAAEWCAPAVGTHAAHGASAIPSAAGAALVRRLSVGETFWLGIDAVPATLRPTLSGMGVRATGYAPVFLDGRYAGTLGFDDCTGGRAWETPHLDVLTAAANAIAAALQARRDAERLARERERAAEERAAELARANDALQAVTDALATARGHDEIVPTVLEIAAQTFGIETAAFYEHPGDTVYLRYWLHEGRVLRPAELLALDPLGQHAVFRRLASGFTTPVAYLGTPPSARTRAVVIDHAAGTLEPDFDAWTRAHGWELELNVPCVVGGTARGALVLYRGAGAAYTPAEVALAEALAKQLALAMEADRLAREVRDRDVERAVARERVAAAEARGAELQQANDAMRRSVERAGAALGIDALLEAFLLEAMAVAGASGGAVDLWDGGRYLGPRCVAQDGAVLPRAAWEAEPVFREAPELLTRDPAEFRTAILADGFGVATVDECDAWWPAAAYHRARGHRVVWNLPLRVHGAAVASLGLAFRGEGPADPVTRATLEALAQQAALALELTRLGDAAREAAIARERQAAAEARAAELARANAALRDTVGALAGGLIDGRPALSAYVGSVLGAVARHTGAAATALLVYDDAADALRMGGAWMGGRTVDPADKAPDSPWARPLPAGENAAWALIARAPDALLVHPLDDARCAWPQTAPWHRAQGHRALGWVPVKVGDRPLGYVGLAFADADAALTPEQAGLARTLAQQLALALELDRLSQAARADAAQSAALEERTRIAREVHDTVAQGLAGIVMQLKAARARLGDAAWDDMGTLRLAGRLADETLGAARRAITVLRPGAPDDESPEATLRRAAADAAAQHGLEVRVEVSGTPRPLPPEVAFECVRVAQAALTNAGQHAGARAATVAVEYGAHAADGVRLAVTDDGRGFDPAAVPPGRFGLVGMRERAARVGAVLSVVTAPGEGTRVLFRWPGPSAP